MDRDSKMAARAASGMWWLFLVTGILWLLISVIVLRFNITSVGSVGILLGCVLLFAGVNEFMVMGLRDVGWKWLHAVLGALFVVAGIMALTSPFQTFGILALLIGWYLLFKGTFDIIISIAERGVMPLWGLGLASGIFEIALAMWALGYPGRSAWLLVLWVGIGALMRGISEIVMAFQLRSARVRA